MSAEPSTAGARVRALILLFALIAAFFSTPLARLRGHVYSSADLTQGSSLARIASGHAPANPMLGDPVLQMQPWTMWSRAELRDGHVPLWNPWNAGGLPHLANYQSAVFSPFSAPAYVLDVRTAQLAGSVLKLAALALFAWLFFRALALSPGACLVGATAFAFAGFHGVWLGYPHVGVVAAFAACMWCAERALQALVGAASPRRAAAWCAALAVSVASAVLAGHPETLFFCLLLVCAWILFRLFAVARERGARCALRAAAALLAAGVAGAGLGAPQLLPFLEYLRESTTLRIARDEAVPLVRANWPLALFPDLAGSPASGTLVADGLPRPNYQEVTGFYVGGVALLLAALGWRFAHADRRFRFFGVLALLWIPYAYDWFGVGRLIASIPPHTLVPINRSQPVWILAIAGSAAFAVEHLARRRGERRLAALLAIALAAAALLLVFRSGAEGFAAIATRRAGAGGVEVAARAAEHVRWMSAAVLAGALLACGLACAPRPVAAELCGAALALCVFAPCGFLLRDYTPTIEGRFFFPRTPALEALAKEIGSDNLLILSEDTLAPHTNMPYGIRLLASYDALWIARYDELYAHAFGISTSAHTSTRATETALGMFGAPWVLTKGDWLPVDTELSGLGRHAAPRRTAAMAPPTLAAPLVQRFDADRDGLDAVLVLLADESDAGDRAVRAELFAEPSGESVASREALLAELPFDDRGRRQLVLAFEPPEESRGRAFRLELRPARDLPAPRPIAAADVDFARARDPRRMEARGLEAFRMHARDPRPWQLFLGERRMPGDLLLDLAYDRSRFERVRTIDDFVLWRWKPSPGDAWIVGRARFAADPRASRAAVTAPGFDPLREVVLESAATGSAQPAGEYELERVERTPMRDRWRARASAPGWLVLSRAWYPGWVARVDGRQVELERANHAFCAVALPAGEHDVELAYEPASFRIGLWIAAASAIAGLAFAWRRIASAGGGARAA